MDTTVERLREFDGTGVIDELQIEAWPDEVPLEAESDHSAVLECFETFRSWADRLDASIEPAFDVRERTTLVSDESESVLVLPVVCLSIYVDGKLASVVPHVQGETAYTVENALADLQALDFESTAASRSTSGTMPGTPSDGRPRAQCPACGEGLESGQGLYACSSCSWVGVDPADVGTTTRVTAATRDGDADESEPVESGTSRTRGPDERTPQPPT